MSTADTYVRARIDTATKERAAEALEAMGTPGSFKRDFKRESKGVYKMTLSTDLKQVIDALVLDQPLAAS